MLDPQDSDRRWEDFTWRGTVVELKAWVPVPIRRRIRRLCEDARFRAWLLRQREEPVLREPVFMIGCPRSGTSISVKLFATHPEVANWSEAMEVWDPHGYRDPEADHHMDATDVTPESVRRLHSRFEWFRQTNGRTRFINKHPRNSVRIDYVRGVFPDARFIHVIRDGRAVAASIVGKIEREPERHGVPFGDFCKPVNWREHLRSDPIEQAAIQWREIVQHVIEKREALGDRYLEFRYEELCEDPRGVLSAAFEFAGLSRSEEDLAGIPERLTCMNRRGICLLSDEQLSTIERVQGQLLRRLGYL